MSGLSPSIATSPPTVSSGTRPSARGKFIFLGDAKLYVRGVTYGTFRPDALGNEFEDPELVERDFAQMAAAGINAVRTYTAPPRWLLDTAMRHGLLVMIGLPWEQHVAFLEDRGRADSIERRVREGVRACSGHPAVLCYAIGNEIPAPIVRWHGPARIEGFLRRLHRAAKAEDPGGLVTYVNYPSTEYLELSFLDFTCFNVFLESKQRFDAYLAHLQCLAGDRPLILAEMGLDSRRHGTDVQAETLDWQVRTAFARGCAGAFVFAWTDEWHRGGHDIEDWDFGLTDRSRLPKPALAAVRRAFSGVPVAPNGDWPRVSVLVCTHNGGSTLAECLQGLSGLDYPDFEVIVVDDGSTDSTLAVAEEFGARVISTDHQGLSAARNAGMRAATGEIVAYVDDDAWPDRHWLTYLTETFRTTSHVAVGGPNVPPPDGWIATCVARAPGGPIHVLLSDQEAEHIPGCNMAFRKEALESVGGFDPRFRVAGDDVDVCWRLRERGLTIGFNPVAVVWHRRRRTLRGYWRQQKNYGRAEALLERKWPEKYDSAGNVRWAGRLYGLAPQRTPGVRRPRIWYGTWGSGPFQSVYDSGPRTLASVASMPEWYLLLLGLAALSALGIGWKPLLLALPVLLVFLSLGIVQAILGARKALCADARGSRLTRLGLYGLTALLHLLQPLARLVGRIGWGLTPWRRRGPKPHAAPWPRTRAVWSESWRSVDGWARTLEASLKPLGVPFRRGSEFDRWELEVRGGIFGSARLRMAIEEHGAGKQLVRFRLWPRPSRVLPGFLAVFAGLSALAAWRGVWTVSVLLGAIAALALARALQDCATALESASQTVDRLTASPGDRVEAGRAMVRTATPAAQVGSLVGVPGPTARPHEP